MVSAAMTRTLTHMAVAVLLLATLVRAATGAPGQALGQADIFAILIAALLYFLSHFLRCIRLSLLAVPLLGMSVRTAVTLHLYTAPVALALPFKLGELFRVQQIYAASRQLTATLVMVVVERLLDASVLLIICIMLYLWLDTPSERLETMMRLTILINLLAVVVFVVAPPALNSLQRYMVLRHTNLRARVLMASVDRIRATTRLGYDCISGSVPSFFLITALIWGTEVSAIGVLLSPELPMIPTALHTVIERVGAEWRWLLGFDTAPAILLAASLISFATLVAVFPVAAFVYSRRLQLPKRVLTRRIVNEET